MTPLEILDQLDGGDLSIAQLSALFQDRDSFQRAVVALALGDEIYVHIGNGEALPKWRLQELIRTGQLWTEDSGLRASRSRLGATALTGEAKR